MAKDLIKPCAEKLDIFLTKNENSSPHKRSPISTCSTASTCRICHDNDCAETLISPCHCTGSLALVHTTCIEKWLTMSKTENCEICKYPFKLKNKCRPIKEWLLSEQGRGASGNFYGDLLCLLLLSPLCFVSIYLCMVGAIKYLEKGHWEGIGLALISASVFSSYFLWIFIATRFHLRCLRNWQQEHHHVRLIENRSLRRRASREIFQA